MSPLGQPGAGLVGQDRDIVDLDCPSPCAVAKSTITLDDLQRLNQELERRYEDVLTIGKSLTRSLVSFQSNKGRAVYRWFKYKEAFSAGLIEHLLERYQLSGGVLLDPFAGSGTALFAAGSFRMRAEGIELLPIGQRIIATKQLIEREINPDHVERLHEWSRTHPWTASVTPRTLRELRITKDAYPPDTKLAIGQYLDVAAHETEVVRLVLTFALLCVLESTSYTRKDGQYLRWDYRSGRRQGAKVFDKGTILSFEKAIGDKLQQIVTDLRAVESPEDLFAAVRAPNDITLHSGSCLDILPTLDAGRFDCVVTSPPYCNRYDYTRTYALELALLGVDEIGLRKLRQDMLSCTVENRAKDLTAFNPEWRVPVSVADAQPMLQTLLGYLENQKAQDLLNNSGIPRMVRGYFYEMACVIAECARVLKPGAPLLMVNDNVRYAGAVVSVDLILAEFARQLGFDVETILVLPSGKGNSSQQMGAHGREALRKCVYVWRKH